MILVIPCNMLSRTLNDDLSIGVVTVIQIVTEANNKTFTSRPLLQDKLQVTVPCRFVKRSVIFSLSLLSVSYPFVNVLYLIQMIAFFHLNAGFNILFPCYL